MRILVIGSGGREHALVWKIAKSKLVDKIFCAPGNGGIAQDAECLDIKADDIPALLTFAKKDEIDLTVVGPELPLAMGIVDEFVKYKLRIFGPNQKAAQLEASKVFAKELMARYRVPTAGFKVFDNPDMADRYIEIMGAPCVIKADGLAAGKGVVVAKTVTEAQGAVDDMMRKKIFGPAGKKIIVEDYLKGQEASILVFTDSKNVIPLASSQDHKRIFDNDQGLNTGGMGAYSPAPMVSEDILREILDRVIYRLIDGLVKEEIYYHGVLYAGIMLTNQGPKALEFNVRFGDPETQAVLPRLKTDVVELMIASAEGRLMRFRPLRWDERSCVCVVISAGGYPGEYEKGKEITGLDEVSLVEDVVVFHAGTKLQNSAPDLKGTQHKYVTSGGRVLGVAGLGETIQEAIDKTYQAVGRIKFEGMHYRRDIGYKALMTNNKILPQ